jgi:hypothetical protein
MKFIYDDNSKNSSWNEVGYIDFYDESEIELDWWMHAGPRPKEEED